MKDEEYGYLYRARDAVAVALRELRAVAANAQDARVQMTLRDVIEQVDAADATLELETPEWRGGGRVSSGKQMEMFR